MTEGLNDKEDKWCRGEQIGVKGFGVKRIGVKKGDTKQRMYFDFKTRISRANIIAIG